AVVKLDDRNINRIKLPIINRAYFNFCVVLNILNFHINLLTYFDKLISLQLILNNLRKKNLYSNFYTNFLIIDKSSILHTICEGCTIFALSCLDASKLHFVCLS